MLFYMLRFFFLSRYIRYEEYLNMSVFVCVIRRIYRQSLSIGGRIDY